METDTKRPSTFHISPENVAEGSTPEQQGGSGLTRLSEGSVGPAEDSAMEMSQVEVEDMTMTRDRANSTSRRGSPMAPARSVGMRMIGLFSSSSFGSGDASKRMTGDRSVHFRASQIQGAHANRFEGRVSKDRQKGSRSSLAAVTDATAGVRHAAGLYTKDERAKHDYEHAMAKITELDKDHDGTISKEEMLDMINRYCEAEHDKHALRRGLICFGVLIFCLIVAITCVTVTTVYAAKDTSTENMYQGQVLTQYNFKNTHEIVACGEAEYVVEVAATKDAYAKIRAQKTCERQPSVVSVKFVDGSVIQFEPRTIACYADSGTVRNLEAGVTLNFETGAVPQVEYLGTASGIGPKPKVVPINLDKATEMKAEPAPRVSSLVFVVKHASITENQTDALDGPDAGAQPQTALQGRKTIVAQYISNTKTDYIVHLEPGKAALTGSTGRLLGKNKQQMWLTGIYGMPDVNDLCTRMEDLDDPSFSGFCGTFNSNGSLADRLAAVERTVLSVGILAVTIAPEEVVKLRTAMKQENNPAKIKYIHQNYAASPQGIGHGVKGGRPAPEHDALHDELQHSLRRHLASTPAGREMGRRKMLELHEQQVAEMGEEEHRRRMADIFTYRQGSIREDETCYRANHAGLFHGDAEERTCMKGADGGQTNPYRDCDGLASNACVRWDDVVKLKTCRDKRIGASSAVISKLECICEALQGTPRPWGERNVRGKATITLTGATPASLCKTVGAAYMHIHNKPFCFYRKPGTNTKSNIAWGEGLVPAVARVPVCFASFYNAAKDSYAYPGYSPDTPYVADWAWHLARLALEDPIYKYSPKVWEQQYNSMVHNGKGTHVFVVDSGINWNHYDLTNAIVEGVDARDPDAMRGYRRNLMYPSNRDCKGYKQQSSWGKCTDQDGHGSHVAGIVAGRKRGIAQGAMLYPVRIGTSGDGVMSAEAMWWIVDKCASIKRQKGAANAYCIVVVSQGCAPKVPCEALKQLMEIPLKHGISVVTSAGNVYTDSCDAEPNTMANWKRNHKSKAPGMVVAGATNIDDSRGYYSNHGRCITAYAPGTSMLSTWKGTRSAYKVSYGTSQAAPVLAGVMCLIAQTLMDSRPWEVKPEKWLNPMTLRSALINMALKGKVKGLDADKHIPGPQMSQIKLRRDTDSNTFWSSFVVSPSQRSPYFLQHIPWQTNYLAHVDKSFFKPYFQKHFLSRASRRARQLRVAEVAGGGQRQLTDAAAEPDEVHHAHRRMLTADDEIEIPVCNATEEVYDDATPCPPEGSVICGNATGVSPHGDVLQRPIMRVLTECAAGCVCDAAQLETVRYESCAAMVCAYRYTNTECNTAFLINSETEAARLEGVTLTYSPLLDVGLNEPEVSYDSVIEPSYASGLGGKLTYKGPVAGAQGAEVSYSAPVPLGLGNEASMIVSLEGETSFPFHGEHYTTMAVVSNGYVAFVDSVDTILRTADEETQYAEDKGPSFSLALTDFALPNAWITHLVRESVEVLPTEETFSGTADEFEPCTYDVNGTYVAGVPVNGSLDNGLLAGSLVDGELVNSSVVNCSLASCELVECNLVNTTVLEGGEGVDVATPFATVLTLSNGVLDTFTTEDEPQTATVQAYFFHETGEISITFGKLAAGINAIVGPSSGNHSTQVGRVLSISDLLDGNLPVGDGSSNYLCDEMGDDAADLPPDPPAVPPSPSAPPFQP